MKHGMCETNMESDSNLNGIYICTFCIIVIISIRSRINAISRMNTKTSSLCIKTLLLNLLSDQKRFLSFSISPIFISLLFLHQSIILSSHQSIMVGWRSVGINYVRYSQLAAQVVRKSVKVFKYRSIISFYRNLRVRQ